MAHNAATRDYLICRLGWRPEKLRKGELLFYTKSIARSDRICFAALSTAIGGNHLKVGVFNYCEMDVVGMGGSRIVDPFIKLTDIDGVAVIRNQPRNILIELFLSFDAPGFIKKVKHGAVVVRIVREHIQT